MEQIQSLSPMKPHDEEMKVSPDRETQEPSVKRKNSSVIDLKQDEQVAYN